MSVIGSDGTVECRCCHRSFPYIAPANANQDGALIHTDCPRVGDSCVTTVPLADILARLADMKTASPVTAEVVTTPAAPAEEPAPAAPAEEPAPAVPAEEPAPAVPAEEPPSPALGGPDYPEAPGELPIGITVDPGSDG